MAYDRRRNSEKYCEPTFDRKIYDVVAGTDCKKHGATEVDPCWVIDPGNGAGGFRWAVCNSRARRAGFHGKISPTSLNINNRGHKAVTKEK